MPFELIDLGAGGTVVCDRCHKDFTNSEEPGGVMIGREAYGPCCAEKQLTADIVRCPEGLSFRAWMLSLR